MSGLKVNFHKIKVYGFNVREWLLDAASTFLYCDKDSFLFKFLGVKVGESPRKLSMCSDLIIQVKNRFKNWNGRHLSFASRVVVINSNLKCDPNIYAVFLPSAN